MISYAQNFEDVMLWRALKDVENGFYIDVGAYHPEIDSVTKWFYDQGWTGINVEPASELIEDFLIQRPLDINLPIAASDQNGIIDYYYIPDTGWSTNNFSIIKSLSLTSKSFQKRSVNCRTLNSIINEHVSVPKIHFLKIDVEGSESLVLNGLNLLLYRPWIILIESTFPNSQIENHELWEKKMFKNQYKLAYEDGLNRYYISKEKYSRLIKYFNHPPNIFDKFISFRNKDYFNYKLRASQAHILQQKTKKITKHKLKAQKVQGKLNVLKQLNDKNHKMIKILSAKNLELNNKYKDSLHQNHLNISSREKEIQNLKNKLDHLSWELISIKENYKSIKQSLTWKLTKPLRKLVEFPITIMKKTLKFFLRNIRKNETVRNYLEKWLYRFGPFGEIFFHFAQKHPYDSTNVIQSQNKVQINMTEPINDNISIETNEIYQLFNKAYENNN